MMHNKQRWTKIGERLVKERGVWQWQWYCICTSKQWEELVRHVLLYLTSSLDAFMLFNGNSSLRYVVYILYVRRTWNVRDTSQSFRWNTTVACGTPWWSAVACACVHSNSNPRIPFVVMCQAYFVAWAPHIINKSEKVERWRGRESPQGLHPANVAMDIVFLHALIGVHSSYGEA